MLPAFFHRFREDDFLVNTGLFSKDELCKLHAESHYLLVQQNVSDCLELFKIRIGIPLLEKSASEPILATDNFISSLESQLASVVHFLEDITHLKITLMARWEINNIYPFVTCCSRSEVSFVACDCSKELRKSDALYSDFIMPKPPSGKRKKAKTQNDFLSSNSALASPNAPTLSFRDYLISINAAKDDHMEILSTANHKHVKEVQVQTDVLDVDFATLLSNFTGLHPELNVVELMMLFIKDKVISELRHVRLHKETTLPRNSKTNETIKSQPAAFLALSIDEALVRVLPKMPYLGSFLMTFANHVYDSDHQPQKPLILWRIFCCLSKIELPYGQGYLSAGAYGFGENILRSGEMERSNIFSNIGITPDYTQQKQLDSENVSAKPLNDDDWLLHIGIQTLHDQVYSHLVFDTEEIIIPPEDINSESYLLKYLVIHADNIDWDATQNEVRGLKTMDVHGTLIGASIVVK